MIRNSMFAFLALFTLLFLAPAAQAQYVIEQTEDGGYNPWIKGQTFTPSVGIVPDPGPVTTLDVAGITFYSLDGGWSGPTSEFYLNIYDGDPVNGSGAFVGSSTEPIDVSLYGNFARMKWTFNHLTLDYNHEYWALVSSTKTDGGLDVYCGMRESGQNDPYAGGTSIAGISGDPDGYHVKPTIDLAFEIELSEEYSLTADSTTLPENAAGTVNFEIDAGSAYAGRTYLLAISMSGTEPGTTLPGGKVLPINWDFLSSKVQPLNNVAYFFDFIGSLDFEGKAFPRFEWPGYPGLGGSVLSFAACTVFPFDFVTNSWDVLIESEPTTPSKELYVTYNAPGDIFHLGKIDYADPETVQDLGTLGQKLIYGLEFAGDGTLYAYESPLWGPGQLYEVNPTNAALTPIGPSNNQRIDSMAYNPVDGKMYGVEAAFSSKLFSIDLNTGAITFEGYITENGPVPWSWISGLAVDDQGYFYIYNNARDIDISDKGIYRSTTPGGLEFEMIHDILVEFGLFGTGLSLQTPAPLFYDWSSDDPRGYGFLRETGSGSQTTGFYGYHWDIQGFGWTRYPLYPLDYTLFYAWTAPPEAP